jgi:acyl-CoA thioester hydrolase
MSQTYSTGIELRFSDLDAYGHVNSAVYFTYLETARIKLFREPFEELSRQSINLLVARAECDYKLPITLNDDVMVSLWLARTGRSSFDLEYRLHDGKDTTYATARTTMVCFDNVRKSTIALPESIRSMA